MTSIALPRRLVGPRVAGRFWRGLGIGLLAGLLLGILAVAAVSMVVLQAHRDRVLPGVTVGGVALAGLTRAEAAARLEARLPSVSDGQLVLRAGETERVVGYAEVGRRYEHEPMLDAAFAAGRSGNALEAGLARLRMLARGTSLPVAVHAHDELAVENIAREVAAAASRDPVEATIDGSGGMFTVTESRDGARLSPDAARDALATALTTATTGDTLVELEPALIEPQLTTREARVAARQANAMAADLVLLAGEGADAERFTLERTAIAAWISFQTAEDGSYVAVLDEAQLRAAIAALEEQVNREPRNASFSVAGAGLAGVIPAQTGRALDVAGTFDAARAAFAARARGQAAATAAMAVQITQPALTTEAAEAALPRMQMVSAWTTYYPPGEGNNNGANIIIPARDIDGRTLAPGEWFEFWSSIGPVTEERGFGYGGVIIGGRSFGTAIGGGICSTSTTLFNAALRYGLQIGDRANHYYYIDRYPTGLDATVYTDGNYTQTMSFRNDTEHPIVIRGSGEPGWVRFEIWSVPTGRTVVLSEPVTSNHTTARDLTEVDTSLPPGTAKRVEWPHDGFDAVVTRTVTDASGAVIHVDTFYSHYGTVDGVTLVNPG